MMQPEWTLCRMQLNYVAVACLGEPHKSAQHCMCQSTCLLLLLVDAEQGCMFLHIRVHKVLPRFWSTPKLSKDPRQTHHYTIDSCCALVPLLLLDCAAVLPACC